MNSLMDTVSEEDAKARGYHPVTNPYFLPREGEIMFRALKQLGRARTLFVCEFDKDMGMNGTSIWRYCAQAK